MWICPHGPTHPAGHAAEVTSGSPILRGFVQNAVQIQAHDRIALRAQVSHPPGNTQQNTLLTLQDPETLEGSNEGQWHSDHLEGEVGNSRAAPITPHEELHCDHPNLWDWEDITGMSPTDSPAENPKTTPRTPRLMFLGLRHLRPQRDSWTLPCLTPAPSPGQPGIRESKVSITVQTTSPRICGLALPEPDERLRPTSPSPVAKPRPIRCAAEP